MLLGMDLCVRLGPRLLARRLPQCEPEHLAEEGQALGSRVHAVTLEVVEPPTKKGRLSALGSRVALEAVEPPAKKSRLSALGSRVVFEAVDPPAVWMHSSVRGH